MRTHSSGRLAGLNIRILALAGLASATLAGCGGGEPATAPVVDPAVERGKAVYLRACALCHGKTADGMPSLGKGLKDNAFVRDHGDGELVEFLKIGRSASDPLNETGIDMPPYGGDPTLTDEDLANVVAYMRSLEGN